MTRPLRRSFPLPASGPLSLLLLFGITERDGLAAGPVVLSEVLAHNVRAIPVGNAFPDFVELHNLSNQRVSLAGASLTDGSATSPPLVFPPGFELAPDARVVVWCDREAVLPPPRAAFGLGSHGDRLRLTGPEGTVWDELTFGLQPPDLTVGRIPDGTGPWQLTRPTPAAPNVPQPLSPPDQLHLNEWMASPRTGDDWLEIYNAAPLPVELSGLVLTDTVALPPPNRAIPALSFLAARGHAQFFASDLRESGANHLDFRLGASSETVSLVSRDRTVVIQRITYGPQTSDTAQGRTPDGGATLVFFPPGQATPAARNLREITEVLISEVLSHTDPPLEDAIEIQNVSSQTVDLSHWWLSDSSANPRKYRVPPGALLPAGGFRVFYEYQFGSGATGFSLNSYEGDEVWLSAGDSSGNLLGRATFVSFGALKNGFSVGTVETSTGLDFAPLARRSFGQDSPVSLGQFRQGAGLVNAPPLPAAIRLAEVQPAASHPGSDPAFRPYLELHNASAQVVPLFDPTFPTNTWRLRGSVRFDFPPGLQLPPEARLLVTDLHPTREAERLAAFRRAALIPDEVPILGPWTGTLPASGVFALELQEPDAPEGATKPRPGFVPYVRVERLEITDAAAWPALPPGGWTSLHRRDGPPHHSNDPAAWTNYPPSPGRAFAFPPNLDTDADHLPDTWEQQLGFDPANPTDALEDADGDGASQLAEYVAGTHPRDATDRLALSAAGDPPQSIRLGFQSLVGRSYTVESRSLDDLSPWLVRTAYQAQALPASRELRLPLTPEPVMFRLTVTLSP